MSLFIWITYVQGCFLFFTSLPFIISEKKNRINMIFFYSHSFCQMCFVAYFPEIDNLFLVLWSKVYLFSTGNRHLKQVKCWMMTKNVSAKRNIPK